MTTLFSKPKIPRPKPLPNTPTRPDATNDIITAGQHYTSLVSSGAATGLSRKANTLKRTLIGGA